MNIGNCRIEIDDRLFDLVTERDEKNYVCGRRVIADYIGETFVYECETTPDKNNLFAVRQIPPKELIGRAIIDYLEENNERKVNGFKILNIGSQMTKKGDFLRNDWAYIATRYFAEVQFCRYRFSKRV